MPKIVKVESKEVGVAVLTLQPIQTKLGPTPASLKVKVHPESLLGSNSYDIPFPLPTCGDHTKVECRIEGLSVGEIYTFTASVSNTFGESDFCSPMYFTVPGKEDLIGEGILSACWVIQWLVYNKLPSHIAYLVPRRLTLPPKEKGPVLTVWCMCVRLFSLKHSVRLYVEEYTNPRICRFL